jgi:hypothetical protein
MFPVTSILSVSCATLSLNTCWLADVLTPRGEPRSWRNDDRSPLGWYEL